MGKIFIAGGRGMVGSAIAREVKSAQSREVIAPSHRELDLCRQDAVEQYLGDNQVEVVFLAAAKVGGIGANNEYPAEFIYQNLMIQTNVIHAAYTTGVKKLLFLGSSCIYPKFATQPIREEELLNGPLEPTNEPYAIAKIAGIKMCESYNRQYNTDFRSVMPTNLYGPGDNYHPTNSHVIPALIRKFHNAKESKAEFVELWGSGSAKREFLFVDDLAAACLHVMGLRKSTFQRHTQPQLSHLNIGSGVECSIKELSAKIAKLVGFDGEILWDASMPDGTPRKLMSSTKLEQLGWTSATPLEAGLQSAYDDYVKNVA